MLLTQGIDIDRSTLAFWVGYAAAELVSALRAAEGASALVLPACGRRDAGAGPRYRTRAHENRLLLEHGARRQTVRWQGSACRRLYLCAGQRCVYLHALLKSYRGIVQCDGYAPYKQLPNDAIRARLLLGRMSDAASSRSPRKAMLPLPRRHSCALPRSTGSKRPEWGKGAEERHAVRQKRNPRRIGRSAETLPRETARPSLSQSPHRAGPSVMRSSTGTA